MSARLPRRHLGYADPGDSAPFFPEAADDAGETDDTRVDGIHVDPPYTTTNGTITFIADPEADSEVQP